MTTPTTNRMGCDAMNTSENLSELGKALAAAQTEITNPAKNKNNLHFKSSYADLAGGLDTIRPILGKHGLSVIQMTRAEGDMVFLYTRLLHSSGQWVEATYPVCRLGKHQEMMSALTYSRRACLFAVCGVAGEDEDDDGNAAATARGRPVQAVAAAAPKSAYAVKKDRPGDWAEIETAVRSCQTTEDLHDLWEVWEPRTRDYPPAWRDQLDELWITQADAIDARRVA
jgi:hypothetical protein